MMNLVVAAGSVLKRAVGEGGEGGDGNIVYKLPAWAWIVLLCDAIVFIPIFIIVGYTFGSVYMTLAMVEDPNPPAYEPLSLNEEDAVAEDDAAPRSTSATDGPATPPKPVTSSMRALNRLLYSVGGWRANFRGIICAIVIVLATAVVTGLFTAIPFVPGFVGTLLASLALVQLNTAWVHIVISSPSPAPFYRRLLPFRKVFEATCFPVLISWAASVLSVKVPELLVVAFDLPHWDPKNPTAMPEYRDGTAWKSSIVGIVILLLALLVIIPTTVLLVRVQASLLPGDEDAIVPFDRSFGGRVEPAIVGGKGYVSMMDALRGFSRGSWVRLYILYGKIFVVTVLVYILMLAVLIPEFIVLAKKSDPNQG